jgi:hypothetical protein
MVRAARLSPCGLNSISELPPSEVYSLSFAPRIAEAILSKGGRPTKVKGCDSAQHHQDQHQEQGFHHSVFLRKKRAPGGCSERPRNAARSKSDRLRGGVCPREVEKWVTGWEMTIQPVLGRGQGTAARGR